MMERDLNICSSVAYRKLDKPSLEFYEDDRFTNSWKAIQRMEGIKEEEKKKECALQDR